MTHVLDTSALLAYHLDESGSDFVQNLIDDNEVQLCASVLSILEFELRLHQRGLTATELRIEVDDCRLLLKKVVNVNSRICARAIELKQASVKRVPTIDALIAATASINGATFVHRDPHFLNIPAELLTQVMLPQK